MNKIFNKRHMYNIDYKKVNSLQQRNCKLKYDQPNCTEFNERLDYDWKCMGTR